MFGCVGLVVLVVVVVENCLKKKRRQFGCLVDVLIVGRSGTKIERGLDGIILWIFRTLCTNGTRFFRTLYATEDHLTTNRYYILLQIQLKMSRQKPYAHRKTTTNAQEKDMKINVGKIHNRFLAGWHCLFRFSCTLARGV